MQRKKKKWKKPVLRILIKGDASEAVLVNCKGTPASTIGPSSLAGDGCNTTGACVDIVS